MPVLGSPHSKESVRLPAGFSKSARLCRKALALPAAGFPPPTSRVGNGKRPSFFRQADGASSRQGNGHRPGFPCSTPARTTAGGFDCGRRVSGKSPRLWNASAAGCACGSSLNSNMVRPVSRSPGEPGSQNPAGRDCPRTQAAGGRPPGYCPQRRGIWGQGPGRPGQNGNSPRPSQGQIGLNPGGSRPGFGK